jgi:hypothetical protein
MEFGIHRLPRSLIRCLCPAVARDNDDDRHALLLDQPVVEPYPADGEAST